MRLSAALLFVASTNLFAQVTSPDTARIAPIIVTATRAPLPYRALPVAVTVISGDDLRLRGETSVADALSDVSSAYVARSGSAGAITSLFLRGGESKYVKVLVDGVPVNDPGGAYDFASLTTDNVDRIEVVRGPVSVVYGADAVTGVVNVITRRGAVAGSATNVDLSAGMAPRDRVAPGQSPAAVRTWDATVRNSGDVPGGDYTLALARHASTGLYQLNNAYGNNVFSARAAFAAGPRTDVRLALHYTDYQYDYPTDAAGAPVDSNAFTAQDRTVFGLDVDRYLSPRVSAALSLGASVNDGGTNDQPDTPTGSSFVSQDKTRRRNAELRLLLTPVQHTTVTLGAQTEQEDEQSQSQGSFAGFPFTSVFRAARRNTAGYGELVTTPFGSLTATLGARLDDNERFGRFLTSRAGMSWWVGARTRVRATAGTAFREPSFFENYATGYVVGNPALQPEHARSADVGLDRDLFGGRARIAATAYAQEFRDMIDYSGDTAACGFSYCNVARARANGVELDLQGRLASWLDASVSVSALRTRVLDPGFDTSSAGLYRRGESLIRRPERTVSAQLSYHADGPLTASLRLERVGPRHDRDYSGYPATPVTLAGYQLLDIAGEYRLPAAARRAAVSLRVENALNAHYQTVYNFLAPRRTISLGVRASL